MIAKLDNAALRLQAPDRVLLHWQDSRRLKEKKKKFTLQCCKNHSQDKIIKFKPITVLEFDFVKAVKAFFSFFFFWKASRCY